MTAPSIKEALERRVALALMQVKARPPACERECFVLSPDPDFDDLPANGDEGTADDEITQEAVLRLARAALATLQPSGDRRDAIARIIRNELLSLDLGCGEDVNIHDAIAIMREDSDVGAASELISDVSDWAAGAILASGLVQDEAGIRAEPTDAQVRSACLSFRHDYGLLPPDLRARTRLEAREWLHAWQKEGFAIRSASDGGAS